MRSWTLVLLVALFVTGCSESSPEVVKTVTVETPVQPAATPPKPKKKRRPRVVAQSAAPAEPAFVKCDPNIEAKQGTTTCEFAQNAFWHYWTSGYDTELYVWSPAAHESFDTSCDTDGSVVTCSTHDGGEVRLARAALDRYSQGQADEYASSHDLGPDPYEDSGSSTPAPLYDSAPEDSYEAPDYSYAPGENIPYYDEGNGYRVQCADGMYSQSGGIQGACSGHGGIG